MKRLAVAAVVLIILGAVLLPLVDRYPVVEEARVQNDDLTSPVRMATAPFHPETAQRQFAPDPLWRAAGREAAGETPAYPQEWSTEGRVLVDVSVAVAAAPTWRVGDRLAIEVPQLGEGYEVTIDGIDEGLGHSRSARGLMAGTDGKSRRFVVTVGPARVFAYIDTPDGPYELTANNRLGWLLPSSSMMAGFDFSKPDYLLQERRIPNGDTR